MEITLEDVRKFLGDNADNDDVKEFLAELGGGEHELTADEVQAYLATEAGKGLIQPQIDQAVTRAIKTHDKTKIQEVENEVKKRVAAEILKLNPQEEPWQKEIRELKEANELEKRERAKDNMRRQISESALKMGIDPFFIDDIDFESIEVAELYMKKIKDRDKKLTDDTIQKTIADGSYKPKGGGGDTKGKMTAAEYARLPLEQRLAMVESGEVNNVVVPK